jgi:hypothetical protein
VGPGDWFEAILIDCIAWDLHALDGCRRMVDGHTNLADHLSGNTTFFIYNIPDSNQ